MRYRIILILITLFLPVQLTSGQYYNTGQDPASTKWMQIKTGRFTVIYPQTYGSGGTAFAQSLDEAYSRIVSLYPEKKFKIPVIIHSFSTQSNGYVAWAPRRMEIYPTPEQNSIPLDPNKQLTLHELTHVFQMESLNRGFSKAVSLFLGEQFTGVVAALLPQWFLEGDAVFAESALSESGRGRSPSFQKPLKAITVERDKLYKYDKIANGSYKDYVPDQYQSGYQMVTWALAKYDPQIWNRVLRYTAEQPFAINPVNISLARSASLTKKTLYKETFDSLQRIWKKEVSENNSLTYESLNPDKKGKYINYYSPVIAGADSLMAVKTSLSDPPSFVLINLADRTEKKIHTPGQIYPWYISYAKGKIVWVETQSDPRWQNRNYSNIKILDIRNNKSIRISHKSRYLSASLSPDGEKIAAIENTVHNTNNLILLNAETGKMLESIPSPGNAYLQRPQWTNDGAKLTVIFLTEPGEGIMSYSLLNQQWETLVEAGREDLQSTFLRNDSLFYISSRSGTDNIYLRTAEGKLIQLSNSRFGVSDLCVNGEMVFFSDYSSSGNNISGIALPRSSFNSLAHESTKSFLINRIDIKPPESDEWTGNVYSAEPYQKWQHLFRFHSWMPFYADIEKIQADPTSIRPGVSIMTQNQLSTLISSIGYEYSQEKKHVFHSQISWEGWYPVFKSQLDYGMEPVISKFKEPVGDPSEEKSGLRFLNTVSLPLYFSSGKFSEYLQPSISSDYNNNYIYIKEKKIYDYGQTILSGRLYFSNYYRSAFRDIYPRWAQTIDLNYSFAPLDKEIYGSAITIKSSLYFPGFLPDNGIKIRLEKEKQIPSRYMFRNKLLLARGYKNIYSKERELYSVDYVMPLAYPDFNIASLLYLKRIRTSLFYDYGRGTGNSYYKNSISGMVPDYYHDYRETFRSFGFELMADFHVLRIPFEISGGVQTAWKDISKMPVFEILFNIDIYGMNIGRKPMY